MRQRKDGSWIDVSLTVSPVRNSHGKIIAASKIARDITERKRSEQQIVILAREAEHRAKNVLATVQATVHLSQSNTPEVSSRQSRDASKHSRTSTGCSSNRAGKEPSFTVWPRRSLRPTPKTERRACRLAARGFCWNRTLPRQLR